MSENKDVQTVQTGNMPAEVIQHALKSGADVEQLEKLLELQERWEANQAKKAYHTAMAKFKSNPPKIDKDKLVSFETTKGTTSYHHATLANITEKINSSLSEHGLSASWGTKQNGKVEVTCKITHELGHSEETTLSADADMSGSKNPIQAIGSTITYLQRYTLLALTGLATHGQDTDGIVEEECITEIQVHGIRDLLIAYGMEDKEGNLVKFFKIDRLEDLPQSKWKSAITAIEARKKVQDGNK